MKNWKRNFYFFLFGQLFSGITTMTVLYAQTWYIVKVTNSATMLSIAAIVGLLPMAIISPLVGPLIDRWHKKYILIYTDLVIAVFALLLFIVGMAMGDLPIWLVLVTLCLRACAQAFQMPTINAIVPTIVPTEMLTKVNGRISAMQSLSIIISPALGALLFGLLNIHLIVLLDVLGFLVGASILLKINIPRMIQPDGNTLQTSYFRELQEGFRALCKVRAIFLIMLSTMLWGIFAVPSFIMYPLMVTQYFKSTFTMAGMVETVWAVGFLVGGIFVGIFGAGRDRMLTMIMMNGVIGLFLLPMAFLPQNFFGVLIFAALNFGTGVVLAYVEAPFIAMVQESFPKEKLGRIMGMMGMVDGIAAPLGLIFAGPFSEKFGVNMLFLIAAIVTILWTIYAAMTPVIRRYDRQLTSVK